MMSHFSASYTLVGEVGTEEEKPDVFWALSQPCWASDAFIFAGSAAYGAAFPPLLPSPTPPGAAPTFLLGSGSSACLEALA